VTGYVNREAARRAGERVSFSFGRNWRKFLDMVDEKRISQAEESLTRSFGGAPLAGEPFFDIGCGSGLFSLAAARLGAAAVLSVDVDPAAVACAARLRARYEAESAWETVQGSVLDRRFVSSLGTASRVYSWGVLHHTGAMWQAVDAALSLVAPGGLCCIALYTTPRRPRLDLALKRTYNQMPAVLQPPARLAYGTARLAALVAIRRRNPVRYVREYGRRSRGMSYWRDVEDWLGGLPYEFAASDEVAAVAGARGFRIVSQVVRGPGACSEYLLRRSA
jgi:predicted RNA methylase